MAYDLVTFGEAMVRLSAPEHMRLEQATRRDVTVGGAEWNVAVNAARLGLKSAWVSRLVATWSGRLIAETARRHGVAVSHVVWVPFDGVGRVRNGFYHLEIGVGPRASAVTYDRGHSAVSLMSPDVVDWRALLAGLSAERADGLGTLRLDPVRAWCAHQPQGLTLGMPKPRMSRAFIAGVTGLEPATSGLTVRRSNQLSYTPRWGARPRDAVGGDRLELPAPCV